MSATTTGVQSSLSKPQARLHKLEGVTEELGRLLALAEEGVEPTAVGRAGRGQFQQKRLTAESFVDLPMESFDSAKKLDERKTRGL